MSTTKCSRGTPVQGGFRAWDHLDTVPSQSYQQPLQPVNLHWGELTQRTLNLPGKLPQLARTYYPMHVDDSHIQDLYFDNTFHGVPGASVQAFVKLASGKWQTQNWTDRKGVDFCFARVRQAR